MKLNAIKFLTLSLFKLIITVSRLFKYKNQSIPIQTNTLFGIVRYQLLDEC